MAHLITVGECDGGQDVVCRNFDNGFFAQCLKGFLSDRLIEIQLPAQKIIKLHHDLSGNVDRPRLHESARRITLAGVRGC